MQNDKFNGALESVKTLSARLSQITSLYNVPKITENMLAATRPLLNVNIPKIEWLEELAKRFQEFSDEARKSEGLSEDEFEEKYSTEVIMSQRLGQLGWVVSEFTDFNITLEWYQALKEGKTDQIVETFDAGEFPVLPEVIDHLDKTYWAGCEQRYYSKGKKYFEANDYMTAAMYLVALIEYRVTKNVHFPNRRLSYKDKFSREGFHEQLVDDYKSTLGFMTKRIIFLDIYPSLIAYLNRLFVDGKYRFENENEPPYVNRNWLLHGRSEREIQRYECIQLLNALSVFEFVMNKDDILRIDDKG